jgi:hypothetical protein
VKRVLALSGLALLAFAVAQGGRDSGDGAGARAPATSVPVASAILAGAVASSVADGFQVLGDRSRLPRNKSTSLRLEQGLCPC